MEDPRIKKMELIYTAFSKHSSYLKDHISRFVLEEGYVPLNPFNIHGYFMLDTLPRELIRCSNNNLVRRADGLWTFGEISNGVLSEIMLAKQNGKHMRYFDIIKSPQEIVEISKDQLAFEDGLERFLKDI